MIPSFICEYWGKAARDENAPEPRWHPLAYHCLDVAAVADVLLARSPRRLDQLAALCEADVEAVRRTFVVLVALHDIGKFSGQFQAKSRLGPRGALPAPPPMVRHDAIGYELLRTRWSGLSQQLCRYLNMASEHERGLWAAVTGHHGAPAMTAWGPWMDGFRRAEQQHVSEFVAAICDLLPPVQAMPAMGERARLLSWALAGLTNVADWIGSNQGWFAFAPPELDLAQYWECAQQQARTAVDEAGILPVAAPVAVATTHLLPHLEGQDLSPLQQEALDCELGQGPILALIEDVTGAGKTEAALIMAARLVSDHRADGLFFALPTMATANAMYDRLGETYRRLFANEVEPSLVLAHGKRALHDGYRDSILVPCAASAIHNARSGCGKAETDADVTASAACTAWIADDRRKAFLAHVGIGTIDQALLGILPSRFQSLRLWGLSRRVLVIDEAHSFDSYMSRELETLLEFHAALGGSAVVLSATLSTAARQRLADAFARGLGSTAKPVEAAGYPLVTIVGHGGTRSTPVNSRPEIARALTVRRITSIDNAVDHAVGLAESGAAVAWIRNSVDDAIAAMRLLEALGISPILLHARFAMGDRLTIEAVVQERLGKRSTPATRRDERDRGLVLVGTQILEQSLDYDVDGMISDLAPVDMIVQRAGRLWRHPWRNAQRPLGVGERALMLLSPDPDNVEDKDWYRTMSPGAAAVYPDHGIVWLSARAVLKEGAIRSPKGVRALLAAVYDDAGQADIPAALKRATVDSDGKRRAARSLAASNSLDVRLGYGGNHRLWEDDTITPTRLGEPVVVFRLAKREGGRIVPWFAADTPQRAWALSECSVRKAMAQGVPAPTGALARDVERAKEVWPEWERDQPLLVLEPDGGVWRGTVLSKDNAERTVLYDERIGWRLAPD